MRQFAVVVILIGSLTGFSACGPSGPELHSVQGRVFFMDQSAAGAQVVFHPTGGAASQGALANGAVKPDGSFTLSTYPHGEGARAGEYEVLVTWFPENARELDNPQNKLPAKYSRHGDAQLKATVKAGENKLEPFRLTK